MEAKAFSESLYPSVSEWVAAKTGLHFPPERRLDLERGLAGAARELGFATTDDCAQWLLSASVSKAQLHILASHLTVGETYFFRDKRMFEVLSEHILPPLLHSRLTGERQLRLWSAACCTGEEAYSLAILLGQLLPDLADWRVTILATDINEPFLQKAATGVYGEWSFRESPAWFKERYFHRTDEGRYAILPEIKKLVTFAHINLVADHYPALTTHTNAMDVIFCRNVLMYFTPAQARKVVGHLHRALRDSGWLAVSPSETSHTLFSQFATTNFPGVILYQKCDPPRPAEPLEPFFPRTQVPKFETPNCPPQPAPPLPSPAVPPEISPVTSDKTVPPQEPQPIPLAAATSLYEQGRYSEAADLLLASFATDAPPDSQRFSLLARTLANQGRLAEASAWCDRWVAADKLDPSAHYLRAIVWQELGDYPQTRHALQRTLYLQPDFILAHFALANLARNDGKHLEAEKHFRTALTLLRRRPDEELLPESDGLTAGRLTEIIASILAAEAIT